jgi:hypothetical protein
MTVGQQKLKPREGPAIALGARVQVEAAGLVLAGRVSAIHGFMLHLAVPQSAGSEGHVRSGELIKVSVYLTNQCWEAETVSREWIWGSPTKLVIGPISEWNETGRRRAPRKPYKLHATLCLEGGNEYYGQTEDLSSNGVSLLLIGLKGLGEDVRGRMTLRTHTDVWCENLPVITTRVRKWLRPGGRAYHVGAQIDLATADLAAGWLQCLARIAEEE